MDNNGTGLPFTFDKVFVKLLCRTRRSNIMNKQNLIKVFFAILLCMSLIAENNTYADDSKLDLSAQSVILMDGKTGQILYGKNENTKHYPASITKLMTALLALENLKLDDNITFSRNAVLSIEFGSSHIGIQEDETLTIDQALHGLLLMSANEIANGLAEETSGSIESFADAMTQKAESIGALNTRFVNPHGLHDENHYTTAYDMALIAKELVKNENFLEIMKDITYQIPPTNKVDEIRYLSQQHKMMNEKRDPTLFRADVIGGKTGYTNEAGHTLVTMAKKGDRVLIAVILNGNGNQVYDDTNALLDYGFDKLSNLTIEPKEYINTFPIIENGKTIGTANVTLKNPVTVLVPANYDTSINFETELKHITSPATTGNIAGRIIIKNSTTPLIETDLIITDVSIDYVVQETVEKKFPWLSSGIIILFAAAIIHIILLSLSKRRKRYYKVKSSVSRRSKNHYSNYAKKRLRN